MADTRKTFGQIYDRYIEKIYRFIFFKVNSQEIAEDLASETFLKTWKVFKNEEKSIENMQAFLYKTARNLVIDYYRKNGKVQIVSVDNPSITDPSQNLEEKEMLRSDVNMVKAALTNLKDDYQNVIIWHYLDDLPIEEISYILGRTEDATRVLLHRALEALKKETKEA
jgi:RNA polymerase sigma-70 factor (ECF subfamily)